MARRIIKTISSNSVLIEDNKMRCPKCNGQMYHPSFEEAMSWSGEFLEHWICDTDCNFNGMWNITKQEWNKK